LIVFPVICPPGPVLLAIARLGPEPKVRTPVVNILTVIVALLMKSINGTLSGVLKIELLGTMVMFTAMKLIS
jgi:hypothetical protein